MHTSKLWQADAPKRPSGRIAGGQAESENPRRWVTPHQGAISQRRKGDNTTLKQINRSTGIL